MQAPQEHCGLILLINMPLLSIVLQIRVWVHIKWPPAHTSLQFKTTPHLTLHTMEQYKALIAILDT